MRVRARAARAGAGLQRLDQQVRARYCATGGGVMVWAVFTDSLAPPGAGFLAGDYFGASGQVTVAAGLGANVLLGGSNNTVALQPISVATSVGLNFALGVAELHLRAGPLTGASSTR